MTTQDAAAIDAAGTLAPDTSEQIPRPVKISWATGALGVAILMNTISSLALFYMVGVLKIEPALAGTLIFVTKIFDIISDPVVGGWSDRIKSARSRRRPFLLAGALIAPASFIMIFTTPIFETQGLTIAYIFTALLIYTLGYTLFNVPYMSMPAEMTQDYHERSSIHGYRAIFISFGGILAFAIAPRVLEELGRTEWSSYALVGTAGGIVIFTTMLIAWAGTAKGRFTSAQVESPKLLKELGHVFSDRHYLRLLGVKAVQLLGVASMQSAMVFFILNVVQRDFKALSEYGLVVGLSSLVAAPLIVRLSKKIGKRGAYIFAAICNATCALSWILANPAEPQWMLWARGVVIAFAASGNIIMAMSMLTDIINHSAKKSGVRREGVYTAFYSFVEKGTFALGPLIIGFALSLAGFNENLPAEEMQTPAIRQALLLGMSYIPGTMCIVSILLLSGYKLREEDV